VRIRELLEQMVKEGSSDLIVKVGTPPYLRTFGELVHFEGANKLNPADTENFAKEVLGTRFDEFRHKMECDLSYEIKGLSRFRVNAFKQRGSIGMVFRRIPDKVPSVEELNLPDVVKDFALRPRGLVLVTGPAGCGKSTTLASLVNHRNSNEACHIVTIEDPVEFLYVDNKAIINQRQVGRDTKSFSKALKYVLRQDPDVIVLGDMRDLETIALAVTAAETGHLVIANLHTSDAVSTIDRIIDVFPPHQQQQIRMQVSVNLVGVVSQLLVKQISGSAWAPAFEVMVATSAVRNMIREAKSHQLSQLLQTQKKQGMISMNQSLATLVRENKASVDEVLSISSEPEELKKLTQSMTSSFA